MELGELLLHDGCINITEVFCDTARLYWISFEWGIFPSESWKFNADGTMIPEDRKRFMEENIEFGEEALNHLESLQNIAAEKPSRDREKSLLAKMDPLKNLSFFSPKNTHNCLCRREGCHFPILRYYYKLYPRNIYRALPTAK